MKKGGLSLLFLVVLPGFAHAGGLPVYDGVADITAKWNAIQRTAAEVRAYAQLIKSYENDIRGVYNTGEMVYQGSKQLVSMPKDLSVMGLLYHYDSAAARLTGMVSTSTTTMGRIYDQVGTVATAEGRATLLQDMQTERTRLMQILIVAKTDQQWIADAQKRLRDIAQAATDAEGQKAVAQAIAQAAAMQAAHTKQVQAWDEAVAKVALLEKLEQQALREAQALKAQEDARSWYATRPMALPGNFHGFMLTPQGGR